MSSAGVEALLVDRSILDCSPSFNANRGLFENVIGLFLL